MVHHCFIFAPGYWLGTGVITFSMAKDRLKYYTRWKLEEAQKATYRCIQKVEMEGGSESITNTLTISDIHEGKFKILLENTMIGTVKGNGVFDEKTIAWEFRNTEMGFEGFEIYEFVDSEQYLMKGEYSSGDNSRTHIEGKIWRTQEPA